MGDVTVLAVSACDVEGEVICAPTDINELFEFTTPLFSIGGFNFTRTVFLIFAAMAIVLGALFVGLRRQQLVPSRFEIAIESLVGFVRDDIAKGVIGTAHGMRYLPYLLSLFFFLLVGNVFKVTPLINFPISSRMAIPAFLAMVTWVIFVFVGFAKNGFKHYFIDTIWPKSVPLALRWLVGLIELVSIFVLRPITLAVRLFANMVAGHLMLTLLLVSGVLFLGGVGDIGIKAGIGIVWFVFGLAIWVFELVVAILQAYIFTLLSAVYIQTSLEPAH
ncbi:MAG: F0F1 ATP synthase subunit A [Acidimicrobiia bacterium]|nr:F0F1 ATP synthase subunit A [bacterium]MXX65331.1 F0F1 ATP synthase subunit A [Acidimicrobiia bacterium]MCY3579744.1 F0F1 ATP synthase subunit A [bacterium]MCY3652955.1 F0F1 ATP synthase subunit A [bacterium]MDE0643085.1 F0F1 ATP synthase subunit A [bacterium]